MSEFIQLITLLLIITVSLIIMRVGAAALVKTGISYDAAIFQSQSAFMGVGFTTTEAESVVSHPVRRRIIRGLMLVGFIAILSTLGTLVVTLPVHEDSWMAEKSLCEMALADEGILILSITRENGFVIGTPASRTILQPGDRLLIYGIENSADRLRERDCGSAGDDEHKRACRRQRLRLVEERTKDEIAESEAEQEPETTPKSA